MVFKYEYFPIGLPSIGIAAVIGLLFRQVIRLIDRYTEPEIMKRHVNSGTDRFLKREAAEGDPMVDAIARPIGRRTTAR